MSRPTLAFLGIGLMGKPMAIRLARSGAAGAVRAWNRSPARAEALRADGVQPCPELGEAVRDAAVVISMLADGPAVAGVVEAALPALVSGTLWIDMSSTRQDEALACAARLAGRDCRFVDAPVSGGVPGADAGTLAIMAGAAPADFAEAEPILRAFGTPVRVGSVGAGQVAKLCNQLIVGATIEIVAEALLLARAAGADPAAVREAIRGGFAGSRVLEVHGQRMLERNFMPGGRVAIQAKDQRNVLAAAAAAGVALPLTTLVTRHYEALERMLPDADHAAALLGLESLNPHARVEGAPDQLPAARSDPGAQPPRD